MHIICDTCYSYYKSSVNITEQNVDNTIDDCDMPSGDEEVHCQWINAHIQNVIEIQNNDTKRLRFSTEII